MKIKYCHNIYCEPDQIWILSFPYEVIFTKTHFLVEDNFIVGVKFSNQGKVQWLSTPFHKVGGQGSSDFGVAYSRDNSKKGIEMKDTLRYMQLHFCNMSL